MRKTVRALLLGAAMMAAIPAHAAEPALDLPADTAPYIQDAIANGDLVGLVVVLVDGDKVTTKSFGLANKETKKAPDENTVFQIGSITKTFTGTLLADAVINGKIRLDDSVQSQLPAGVTLMQVGDRPITIADVATHRSGLPRLEVGFAPVDPTDPYADIDDTKLWKTVSSLKLTRAPGATFEYSNLGFGLLGRLVAKADGGRYQDLVAAKILKPLGMTSSSADLPAALRGRAAQGYDGAGKPAKMWTFNAVPGLGSINSTAKDMTAYLRANMAAAAKAGKDTELNRAMTLAQTPRADAGGGKIGLAWIMAPGGSPIVHDGGTYGYSSFIAFKGDGSRGVVVLANMLNSELTSALGTHVLNPAQALPPLVKKLKLSDELLQSYVGSYALAPGVNVSVVRADSQISIQIPGQPANVVYATAPGHFIYKGLPVAVDFDSNPDGKIARLVFHQQGQRFRAPRLSDDGKPLSQPTRLMLDITALDGYAGDYEITPGALIKVRRDGDHLTIQTPNISLAPIFSERPDHFEFETTDVDLDFERDTSGKVVAVVAASGANKGRAVKVVPPSP